MVYIFIIQKISFEWVRLQPFLNTCCKFAQICHINIIRYFFFTKYGSWPAQNKQQIPFGGFIEGETSVFFCPLFVLFKIPLTLLTYSAMIHCVVLLNNQHRHGENADKNVGKSILAGRMTNTGNGTIMWTRTKDRNSN